MRLLVGSSLLIKNDEDYNTNYSTGQGSVGTFASRTAGLWGNNILVATCPSATAYESISASLVNARLNCCCSWRHYYWC